MRGYVLLFSWVFLLPMPWAEEHPLAAPSVWTATSERFSARLEVLSRSAYGRIESVTLHITARGISASTHVVLSPRMQDIYDLTFVAGDRLLVIATLPYGGYSVTQVDLPSASVHPPLWCHDYSIAATSHAAVFLSWHPRQTTVGGNRSILLAVDFLHPRDDFSEFKTGRFFEENRRGYPIFPELNAREKTYDITLFERWALLSPVLWADDGSRLAFIGFFEADEKNALVLIDLSRGLDNVSIRRKDIDLKAYLEKAELTPQVRASFDRRIPRLLAKALRWEDHDTVVVEQTTWRWLPEEYSVTLP